MQSIRIKAHFEEEENIFEVSPKSTVLQVKQMIYNHWKISDTNCVINLPDNKEFTGTVLSLNPVILKLFPEVPLYITQTKLETRQTRGISRISLSDSGLDNRDKQTRNSTGLINSISSAFKDTIESTIKNELNSSFKTKENFRSKIQNTNSNLFFGGNDEISIQIVIQGGHSTIVETSLKDTVEELKKKALITLVNEQKISLSKKYNLENLPLEKYCLKYIETKQILDEQTLIAENYSIIESRQSSITPSLLLSENYSITDKKKKAQKVQFEIGFLTGRPLCWTQEEDETNYFRHNMKKIREVEFKKMKEKRKQRKPAPEPPKTEEKGILFNVKLPLTQSGKKTAIHIIPGETVQCCVKRIFDKFYKDKGIVRTGITDLDFGLRILGRKEFLNGDSIFDEITYIANFKGQNTKRPELILDMPEEFDSSDGEDEDEDEEAQGISYSHDQISFENKQWDELTFISIWEMKKRLSIRILGCDYISLISESKLNKLLGGQDFDEVDGCTLYSTIGLYHGGTLLAPLVTTNNIMADSYPRWNERLEFQISMCDIPRNARLSITVWAKYKGESAPVGWVNSQLFDYKHELKQGVMSFLLWPDDEANPIGTCVQNSNSKTGPNISVEFDSYPLSVVFPTELPKNNNKYVTEMDDNPNSIRMIAKIVKKDSLYKLSEEQKIVLWNYRSLIANKIQKGLSKLLSSVPYDKASAVQEMHKLLANWEDLGPIKSLELLDARFGDARVREYAVKQLEQFTDIELSDYLLQLTQVLKYEPYHDSALARFLIKRALRSREIGHNFFWFLKSEMHVNEISERYGLLLEAYLRGAPGHRRQLMKQETLMQNLIKVANEIKPLKDGERLNVERNSLKNIDINAPVQLPLNPNIEIGSFRIEKCKYMDSKKLPLWLVFENADHQGDDIYTIFKSGDDLRQDMLTLQMIRIMDRIWKSEGLDFQMNPYGCISTGDGVGFIEVVLNSETTAQISKQSGGATAAFKEDPLDIWMRKNNPDPTDYKNAVTNFVYSCAGYCVSTYVLGIGDRHNDNIMVQKNGKLFHIDFGHFLGNFKKKFGIKRERAPFVFTPDFAFVMGGKDAPDFNKFVELCCNAYNILRKHANLFINLFAMMLSTGIPELKTMDDINYLRDAFSIDSNDHDAAEKFKALIYESLATKTTQINNMIHLLVH